MAKLKDVADEVGVSVSLVSKVLNNRLGNAGARKELMEHIRKTADAMGYQPNLNASSLVTKRQNAIAIFIHRTGANNVTFAEDMLEGIARSSRQNNLRVMLHFFMSADEYDQNLRKIHKGVVDAVIVGGIAHPERVPALLKMQESGLKVVTVHSAPLHTNIPNIGLDESEAAYLGVNRMIKKGHRAIAHFSLSSERTRGYRRAMKEAGIKVDPRLIIQAPVAPHGYFYPLGAQMTRRLLKKKIPFDGISAQSDAQALGAMNELIRQGVRVPEDVMITGIDDTPSCKVAMVPLTSVNQNYKTRGELAVEMVEGALSTVSIQSVNVSGMLMPRASTGD